MTWLLEEPLPIILTGLVLIAALGGVWIRTGRQWLVYALAAVVIATAGMLLLEKSVVTYREQIDATLHQCAADVESNDLEAVLRHVDPQAPQIRKQVEAEFPKYRFKEVRIARNLEILVHPEHDPPTATAEFNALAVGADRGGMIENQKVVRFVQVDFRLNDDGQWRVIGYAHRNPMYGMKKRQARTDHRPDFGRPDGQGRGGVMELVE